MKLDHSTTNGPLAGIRVADFSRVLAGPYASMMLADFGADVIKIEGIGGDDTRHWAPQVDAANSSTYFDSVNRNKRSVVCDLASDAGLNEARRLAVSSDIVIENFRPHVMRGFGLDHVSVRTANPRIIYCSITGFGSGEGAELPGYDLLVQALGGLMSVTGAPDGPPMKAGVALVDVLTGLNAFAGVLLALRERETTGQGDHVEVDLFSTLLAALTNLSSATLANGTSPVRLGNAHPTIAPYEVFRCEDRDLVIAVGNDRQFEGLAQALELPSLALDARFVTNPDRVRNREALRETLHGALVTRPAAEWKSRCDQRGVPAGFVNTIAEAFEFAHRLGSAPIIELSDDRGQIRSRQPSNPIRLSNRPTRSTRASPRLGEHNGADWLDHSSEKPR